MLSRLKCLSPLVVLLIGCNASSGANDVDAGNVDVDGSRDAADVGRDAPMSWDVRADRSILAFTADTAVAANQAALPADWAGIDPTRCAADPTRQFLAELVVDGFSNPQVLYHWAPIVPGPDAGHPLQGAFDFYLAGEVVDANESSDDVRADHPFGFDFTWNVEPDPEFEYMATAEGGEDGEQGVHSEIEMPVFPRQALGFDPVAGDRSLQRGAWVLDCGHPPYGAELHPPTFLAFARASEPEVTESVALVNPYRIAQFYAPSPDDVASFDDASRFDSSDVRPLPAFLVLQLLEAFSGNLDRLEGDGLMEALRFDRLEWDVCAPLPRPEGASLAATWRFTARTGVTVQAFADEENGCVHLIAEMDDSYVPAPLVPEVVDWPWDELSDSASGQVGNPIDVRRTLIALAESLGHSDASTNPALAADNPPAIVHFEPLVPRADADQAAPTQIIEGADDQPFPFYGRVRATWE